MDADVVVVGAGLAGLRCAQALTEAGRDVVVLEASDVAGGRIRTERIDGFLVDRGFQLLNPAYPAVRRWVDVEALGLQPFGAGVAARTEDGTTVLGHPVREPGLVPGTLRAVARRPKEVAALARWAAPLLRPRRGTSLSHVLASRPDVDRRTALDAAHVDGLLRRVVDRFYAGVLLEDDGSTADRFALLLAWMFAKGVPSLPRNGMAALPAQLAASLGDRVRLGQPVQAVTGTAVTTDAGTWTARHVVVATGAAAAAELTGLAVPATKGVVTMWWAAADAPDTDLLHVDARRAPTGPLVNAAVVSRAAPSYAPAGRHLLQGSALMGAGRDTGEASMRRHAGDLLGTDPTQWEVVVRHEVPDALPAQPAPYDARRPVQVGDLVVCGDHRDTGSIQGALVSGQRAAEALL
ncbi:Phytoene dehydrogenase-related protein [Nocardioides alpinus]|uniref:Amine oxidase n=1 Tax=Nocardioides alpinus TaxID=748909 RepID=A0A1I1AD89_9ACTN|nr:NAD(P)/FAD-dependent oxidoreductase [Nocardioides alpinus]PKH43526.1 amine oxidase [Nocardioides alpinus]SFB35947.1 Phytoene dehydrogenase-related protein [Nocardioides alpinus]